MLAVSVPIGFPHFQPHQPGAPVVGFDGEHFPPPVVVVGDEALADSAYFVSASVNIDSLYA